MNASYDSTREFYQDFNKSFAEAWEKKTGEKVEIDESNAGSAKQARAVMEGLRSDVVTLGSGYDIDMISRIPGLLPASWEQRLPDHSSPYTSTIVFLVRKGNPKRISGWEDLSRPGLSVIIPNPRTSAAARWGYLAAWGYAAGKYQNDPARIRAFMTRLFRNVPVLETGSRAATATFVDRGLGDVLVSWESEAMLSMKKSGGARCEIVTPRVSILAEPPVAWVDRVTHQRGTEAIAKAYLEYLYSPAGQEIAAEHFFRPRLPVVARKYASRFPSVKLFTISEAFGSWEQAENTHFREGGTFDQIQESLR